MQVNPLPSAIGLYVLAALWLWSRKHSMTIGWLLLAGGATAHLVVAGGGWLLKGVPPVAGAGGFLLATAWFLVVFAVVLSVRCRGRERLVGSAGGLAALLLVATSFFPGTPGEMPPALRSPWFPIHVSLTALGEAALGVAFVAAMLGMLRQGRVGGSRVSLLVFCSVGGLLTGTLLQGIAIRTGVLTGLSGADLRTRVILGVFACGGPIAAMLWWVSGWLAQRLPREESLLDLQVRSVRLGYALFSLGALAAGMAWARDAWGSWWSWDPKETASLAVWLMLTVHVHLGSDAGWESTGNRALVVAVFIACLANLLGTFGLGGLHAYG